MDVPVILPLLHLILAALSYQTREYRRKIVHPVYFAPGICICTCLPACLKPSASADAESLISTACQVQPCKVSDDQSTGSPEQITEAATLWDLAHLHRTAAAHGLRVSTPTQYAPFSALVHISMHAMGISCKQCSHKVGLP